MNRFQALPAEERADYLRAAADRLGVLPVIVEKDLWVCWMLGRLFSLPHAENRFVFKGGTSLSKVFGAIHRFSEDIDLGVFLEVLDWEESRLEAAASRTQRDKLFKQLQEACGVWVDETLRPVLEASIRESLGESPSGKDWLSYEWDSAGKAAILHFAYPSAIPSDAGYIAPFVKLEFGSHPNQQPRGPHAIRSLASEVLGEAFEEFSDEFHASVIALEAERTFWEKATILHAEYHRPPESTMKKNYARHYSDLAALWVQPAGKAALQRLDLLAQVTAHKERFFRNAWTSFEKAVPGALKLVPPETRMAELRRDYASMQLMFLKPPVPFDQVIETLAEAEQTINGGSTP